MIFLFFLYKLVFLFFSFIPPPEKRIKTFILYLGVKGLEAENEVFFKHFVSLSEIHPVFHFWGSKITPVRGKGLRTLTGCLSEVRKGRKPPLRFKHSEGHTAWRVGPCRGPALRCAALPRLVRVVESHRGHGCCLFPSERFSELLHIQKLSGV